MFAGHIWLDSLSNLKAVQGARRVAATAMNLPVERTRINITMTAIRITIPSPPANLPNRPTPPNLKANRIISVQTVSPGWISFEPTG